LKCSTIFSPALTSWTIETYAGYTGICWHIHSWHAQWQTKWSIFHSAFPWVLLHAEAWQGPFHYHRRQNQVGTVCRRILIGLFGLTLRTKNSDTVTMCFLFFLSKCIRYTKHARDFRSNISLGAIQGDSGGWFWWLQTTSDEW
jgi:hypothetical protein